jgi:hypothetical protein
LAGREDAMTVVNAHPFVAEACGKAGRCLGVAHDAWVEDQRLILKEYADILRYRVEQALERSPCSCV